MGAKVELIGLAEVERALAMMPDRSLNKKILGQACRATATAHLFRAAKSNLASANPATAGARIEENVKVWAMTRTFRAGVNVGYKPQYDKKDASIVFSKYTGDVSRQKWSILGGLWLEHGTLGIGRAGRYRGRSFKPITATGWFRRAVDTTIGPMERDFRMFTAKKINAYLSKYIKKFPSSYR